MLSCLLQRVDDIYVIGNEAPGLLGTVLNTVFTFSPDVLSPDGLEPVRTQLT